jgi:hypothetical protein
MMQRLWKAWDQSWFTPQNLLGLALMRILLCGTMFSSYLARQWNMEYYTDLSWIPRSKALEAMGDLYRPLFLWSFWPDSLMSSMHILLVVLLGLLALGIGGRWIMWMAWILDMAFIQRNYAVNFGADIIAALFLFYLSFTQSCERLSVLNLFNAKKEFRQSDFISSMMMRMMQVQISVIYVYTGWEKLKGASWWDGTALWSVMANPQMTTMNFEFLRNVPWMIPVVAYMTILFEIYFPAMIVSKKMRLPWLVMGAFFHLGIAIFVGLWNFAFVMVSTYFLFIDPIELRSKIISSWHSVRKVF